MKIRIRAAALISIGCLSLIWAVFVLTSCQTSEPEPLTFRYHLWVAPPTLDPARAEFQASFGVIDRLFDGLMRLDRVRGVAETELAAAYSISADGLEYEFQLLPNARFHNGRTIQASDFKFAWERLLAPATDSPRAWMLEILQGADAYRRGEADAVDGLEVVGPHTLRLRLTRPFDAFLYYLAHPATSVLPAEEVRRLGDDFGRRPVGSGPFRYSSRPDESTLVLEAFDGHPIHSPRVRTLIYQTVADWNVALDLYQTGKLDLVARIPFGSLPEVRQRFSRDLRLFPGASWLGFCFPCDREPFHDPRVRQAVSLALDRDAIVDEVGIDVYPAAVGFLPQSVPGHDPATLDPPFNPERAVELLAAAGYPNGEGFPPQVFVGVSSVLEKFLAKAFSRLGVEVGFKPFRGIESLLEAKNEGKSVFTVLETGFPDPETYLGPRFHSRGQNNHMAYRNPEVDRLLEKARRQHDPATRLATYHQAERLIIDEAPCLVLLHFNEAILLHSRWRRIPVGYDAFFFEIELARLAEEDS